MAMVLLPLVTFLEKELRDVSVVRFASYFSSRGAFILLFVPYTSGELSYGAPVPVSYTGGLPMSSTECPVQCLAQSRQSVTICGTKGRNNESVLLDNRIHPYKTCQN